MTKLKLPMRMVCLTLTISLALAAVARAQEVTEGPIPGRYIVVLRDAAVGTPAGHPSAPDQVREVAAYLSRLFGLRVERVWGHALNGFVAELDDAEARRLARHPFVESVEQDLRGQALSAPPSCYSGQTLPQDTRVLPDSFSNSSQVINCADPNGTCIDNWGIDRVDQRSLPWDSMYSWGDNGYAVHVYVIDTGIDHHREFRDHLGLSRVIQSFGADFTTDGIVTDCYGHGTHVAALIAGRTYGVAKDAVVIPVKFVTCSNQSQVSWLISSIDYVRQQVAQYKWPAVANLSGGNRSDWSAMTSLQTAAQNLIASGVQLVQSAGNQNQLACSFSLGNTTDTLVVGGTTHTDSRWDSSNYGSCVDLFAPAALITSAAFTSGDGSFHSTYCELTGTSMAAPHVTGALALYLDANHSYTPAQLRSLVLGDATNGALTNIGTGSPNKLLYVP